MTTEQWDGLHKAEKKQYLLEFRCKVSETADTSVVSDFVVNFIELYNMRRREMNNFMSELEADKKVKEIV